MVVTRDMENLRKNSDNTNNRINMAGQYQENAIRNRKTLTFRKVSSFLLFEHIPYVFLPRLSKTFNFVVP